MVVVHEPGDWFEKTLDSFAGQDYPNLRFLFLVTDGATGEIGVEARIKVRLPDAFVRSLDANPGFGASANEVLRLVEGANGLFLFCHDDVALEPDAVRTMVEEMYRSNAGVVGPKLVEWDDPGILQAVGLDIDRFGEVDHVIEPGEVDQEQHDGVRDVFVVPTACLLIRADLFREVGGFYSAIDFYGDDVELCWRVHLSGARVIVAPSARVRHRGDLADRRPDLRPRAMRARHRMRNVTTLTGAARLPGRSLELVLLTITELFVGIFTGTFGEAAASLRALIGLIPRTPALIARRRAIKDLRQVPDREVTGLQERGSARLNSYLRSRETTTYVGSESSVRRWRQSASAAILAWIAVLAAILIGSRSFISSGVPAVGEFLPMPASPGDLFDSFASGWNPAGSGATSSNPTGWATVVGLSFLTVFRMGMLHTALIVGLVVLGTIGMWKLASVFPSTRARIAALVVFAATPLVSGAMSIGSFNSLVAYAATPWIIHTLRRAVGVETADPNSAASDVADGLVSLSPAELWRRTAAVIVVVALATAFTPVMLPIALALAALLAIGTLLALGPWRTALRYIVIGIVGVAGAALLNVPWITTWSWDALVGPPPLGDPGRGLIAVASFEIGRTDFAGLALLLYLPVVVAPVLARAWRLTWAVRAGLIVVSFGALAVLADRGELPFAAPEAGILLAPVAAGLAISAAAAVAAFDLDVRGGTFGWRQPLGILASIAVVVGVIPGVAAITDGAWQTPSTPLAELLGKSLPDPSESGDYNVLLIGDARILPVPSTEYRDGISFAVIGADGLDFRARWAPPTDLAADDIRSALDEMSTGSTLRAGSLLAPLGVRRVVIPEFDGVISTTDDPLPPPAGLVTALENQLDMVKIQALATLEVFENTAWLPKFSLLTGPTAEASAAAGAEARVAGDLSMATPILDGADQFGTYRQDVEPGVVHLAVPFDDNWDLRSNGSSVEARRAFGLTTGFDVVEAGEVELTYSTPASRPFVLVLLFLLWVAVLISATRVSVPLARRRLPAVGDETLIDLDALAAETVAPVLVAPGLDPGLDMTGEFARVTGDQAAGPDSDSSDAGPIDAGAVDAGAVDAGATDAGCRSGRRRRGAVMSRRAIPGVLVIVLGLVAVAYLGRETPPVSEAVFAPATVPWMPAAFDGETLTDTWFCPGVPASGEEGIGGEVVVANRGPDQLVGRFAILTSDGVAAEQEFTVGAWSRRSIDVDAFVVTDFASAVVEIDGGGAVVEQVATHPDGTSVAPCSNDTSDEWYLADGYTVDGSVETLILTNPYGDTAVANLTFATETGQRTPNAFQGFAIPPRSVKTIRIAELGARDEPIIAVSVGLETGRLVLGRAQQFLGGARNGYDVSLAAPALRDQWWFADGELGEGITETFSVYNPTSSAVDVDVVFLGLPAEAEFGYDDSITVPAGEVIVFEPAEIELVPVGRHAVVFSTLAEPSIVVERVLTRPIDDAELAPDDRIYTTVVLGATGRTDGYVASQWHIGVGPSTPAPGALVVYNTNNVDGTITVEAVGPAGPSPVPSLTDIPLAAGAVMLIDLESDAVLDQELIVTSTNRVFVERLFPRGGGLAGRSGSWALPLDL